MEPEEIETIDQLNDDSWLWENWLMRLPSDELDTVVERATVAGLSVTNWIRATLLERDGETGSHGY